MEIAIFGIGFWLGGVFVASIVLAHGEGLRSGAFERREQRPEIREGTGLYTADGTIEKGDLVTSVGRKIRVAR